MSYAYSTSYASPSASGGALPPLDTENAAAWIRSVWADFQELFPRTLGIQHEAAELAATTGNADTRIAARELVTACGQLIRLHSAVVKQVESYGGYLGLGAGPGVVALAVVFASLALIMLWIFRRYDALSETLEAVRAGDVTPTEAAALLDAAGPMPDLSVLGGVGVGTLVGALAVVGILWYLSKRRASNPDLVLMGANPQPDGTWSRRVLALDYVHDDDGEPYTHSFRPGVRMQALEDGSVRLFNPRRRIWRDF